MNSLIQLLRQNPAQVSAIVGMLALSVSFLSILLTVFSLYFSRQHSYKSLTPIASVPLSDYENEVAVKVKNTGVGPLIIDKFRATDGSRTEDDLISLMPPLPRGMLWDTFFDDLDGACIPPGEQLGVLQLSGNPNDRGFANARDACRRTLAGITIVITYKDIYGRSMPRVTKGLRWFGRHFV